MAFKTWNAGDSLLAADINTYLANQSIPTFASASARATAIPAPVNGQASYLLDTGSLEIWTTKTSPASWQKPWNMPWGLTYNALAVGEGALPGGWAYIVSNIPCNIPGRMYRAEYEAQLTSGTGAANTTRFQWYWNASTPGSLGQFALNESWGFRIVMTEIVTGAASNALGIQAYNDAPGTKASLTWVRVRVYDIGPA